MLVISAQVAQTRLLLQSQQWAIPVQQATSVQLGPLISRCVQSENIKISLNKARVNNAQLGATVQSKDSAAPLPAKKGITVNQAPSSLHHVLAVLTSPLLAMITQMTVRPVLLANIVRLKEWPQLIMTVTKVLSV